MLGALALVASFLTLGLVTAPAAHADGPGVGSPWVVSLGDSYISGEAGRWAGSSNSSSATADALGGSAYHDNASGTGETINRCHRSKVGRDLPRRRRQRAQPRVLGREDDDGDR